MLIEVVVINMQIQPPNKDVTQQLSSLFPFFSKIYLYFLYSFWILKIFENLQFSFWIDSNLCINPSFNKIVFLFLNTNIWTH